jgi:hypothetical protein
VGTTLGQWLVAIFLALVGASSILYAGYMTLPLVEQAVEVVWWVVGAAGLVAAVGVLRWAAWARVLGISVLVAYAAWAVSSEVRSMSGVDILDLLARWIDLLIMVGLSLALWWLVKRWPSSQRAAT